MIYSNCFTRKLNLGSVYTRVRKPRLSELGIWMVSRAREDGLKGNVTG